MSGIRFGAIALVGLMLVIGGLEGDKPPKKLLGYWEVVKLESKEGKVKEGKRKFIEFHKDGTMQGGKVGSIADRNGLWAYHKEQNSVEIRRDGGSNDDGIYLIEKLSSTDLILFHTEDSVKVFLEKYEK